jgi:hypothetical protein
MAEWLYEDGIGERRAALVADGRIVKARIERDSDGVRAGAVLPGRLISRRERLARLDSGEDVYIGSEPRIADGSRCLLRITRRAIPERDLVKRPRAEIMMNAAGRPDLRETLHWRGGTLREAIDRYHAPVRALRPVDNDEFEQAGWSEMLDAARSGIIPFDGGLLRLALTPAMAVFDVDGTLPSLDLAMAGAKAAAAAILQLNIGGNIVIDLPTIRRRDQRGAIGEAFNAVLADLSGYSAPMTMRLPVDPLGLLHLARPRGGPSIVERMQFAPVESSALALLRRAERARGTGVLTLVTHPQVTAWLDDRPALTEMLARRSGRIVVLQPDAARAIWGGDVH